MEIINEQQCLLSSSWSGEGVSTLGAGCGDSCSGVGPAYSALGYHFLCTCQWELLSQLLSDFLPSCLPEIERARLGSREQCVLCSYACSLTRSLVHLQPQFGSISRSRLWSDLHSFGKSCDFSVFSLPLHILWGWSCH